MAPALASDPASQADTPMTDTNDDTVPSVPVDSADAQMVCEVVSTCLEQASGMASHMYLCIFFFWFQAQANILSQSRATKTLQITR